MSTRDPDSVFELNVRDHQHGGAPKRPWQHRAVFWLFIGIAAFYLIAEHRAHLVAGLSWLPFLLLLACPLLHVFMHGGHGGQGSGGDGGTSGGTRQQGPTADASAGSKARWPHTHGG